jgi:ABC-2 type transport system permease protein
MSSGARIIDQGYRPYEGPRHGVGGSIRAVAQHSIGRVLGRRRGPAAKVLPILILAISVVPAITFVGMAALLPRQLVDEGILPSYGEYYGYITSAIVIFSAFVAPDLLCTDRRTRMLGLLLASPLDRTTYLAAKAIAVVATLSVITIGPPLLMLVAFTMEGAGPGSPADWLAVLGRILLAGVVIAALHATLSLAVSSFTDRNGFASAGVLLTLLLTSIVAGILIDSAGAPTTVAVFDLLGMPFELITRIYPDVAPGRAELSTVLVAAANLGWTLLFAAVVAVRYRRIQVTR